MDEQDANTLPPAESGEQLPLEEPTALIRKATIHGLKQAKPVIINSNKLIGKPLIPSGRDQAPLRTAGVPRIPQNSQLPAPGTPSTPLPPPRTLPPWSSLLKELESSRDEELLALIKLADPAELMSVINLSPSSSPLRGRIFSLAVHLIPVAPSALAVEEIQLLWDGLRRREGEQAE